MISRSTVVIIAHIRNNIYYPDSLKVAKVTSIYKKDNKKFILNYRPISVLPVIPKVDYSKM